MTPIVEVQCPVCGEPTHIHLSEIDAAGEFVEDCQVCCRPMLVCFLGEDEAGEPLVRVERES